MGSLHMFVSAQSGHKLVLAHGTRKDKSVLLTKVKMLVDHVLVSGLHMGVNTETVSTIKASMDHLCCWHVVIFLDGGGLIIIIIV
jgi:hypothetical protein